MSALPHGPQPLALERVIVGKMEKLIPNLQEKKKYVLHYRDLKQALEMGLKIMQIHRGISFDVEACMKPYIELTTGLRAKAQNEFEKDFVNS